MMRVYFSFFRMRLLALIQYRAAAIAGMATNWTFGMMRIMVMIAFYASAKGAPPMSLAQSVTYIWLGQMLLGILPWNLEKEVSESVLTGQIAYELTRPIDIYAMWFMRTLAFRVAPTMLRGVPMFIICAFLLPGEYRLMLPGPAAFGAFALSLLGALVLSASITNLMHAYVLVTQRSDGVVRIVNAAAEMLSGMIIPLTLMPDGLAGFLRYQPFAGVVDLPVRLYCGNLMPDEVWTVLGLQLTWAAALIAAGRFATNRGLRRIAVAGG